MTDQPLDLDLAARLRASADERIRQQIETAKQQSVSRKRIRAEFAEARSAGLRQRHQIRTRMITRHQTKEPTMTDTTTAFDPAAGPIHEDVFGEKIQIRSCQSDNYDKRFLGVFTELHDSVLGFTPDQARQIAADLIAAANATDGCPGTHWGDQAHTNADTECGTCHPDGDYSCRTCFPRGVAHEYLTGVCGQPLPCDCTDCTTA